MTSGVGTGLRKVCAVGAASLALMLLLCMAPSRAEEMLRATGFKIAGDATRTRIMLNFDAEPQTRWFLLRSPHRLVIDVPQSVFAIDPQELKPRGLVTSVRYGHLEEGKSRLIIGGKGPFELGGFDIIANEDGSGHRIVVDMVASSEQKFEAALAAQADKTGSTAAPKSDRLGEPRVPVDRKFTVVVDAGHGGIDGGANGLSGTVEKDITLAFALELRAKLLDTGRFDVVMTRDKDEFLRLDERVRIARQAAADLFVSVHADTIRVNGVHGATVYTVADRASDAEAQALADRENLADQMAGIDVSADNQDVVDILADLIRRETHTFSIHFAKSLVTELRQSIDLIKNPHREAGFRVLRAPDVPSVLIELGYLSSAHDEERLKSQEWRSKAADRIVSAINIFATSKVGAGG